jgi:predicted amidohydrolase YtcJ
MKKLTTCAFALVLAWISVGCAQQGEVADVIYTNGRIYTVNEAQPWVEAVAITDGKFIKVGSNDDVEAVTGEGTETVDLSGQFVMPGLIDTHTHPFASAIDVLDHLVLDDPKNLEDIQQQVLAYAKANPDKEWIEGLAWPKGMFKGENAMREWLDEVITDRPVSLMDQGGHARWVNTKALEVTGIMDPDFVVPQYGIVERDENGVPSGTVRETMLGYLATFAPAPGPD